MAARLKIKAISVQLFMESQSYGTVTCCNSDMLYKDSY